MSTLRTYFAALALAAPMMVGNAQARDVTLVVDASTTGLAYYMSLPAEDIATILGTDPALLFSEDGKVPIDTFRQTGSFELGDDVFRRIEGAVDEQAAPFETMSMMVHPLDDPAPFQTPWDAVTATAVCNVDYDATELVPGALQLYYGAYAHDVDSTGRFDLSFPETGRDDVRVTMHLYRDGDYVGQEQAILADGDKLSIQIGQPSGLSVLWWGAAVIWALMVLAALIVPRGKNTRGAVQTST